MAYYSREERQAGFYEASCVHPPWGQACPELGSLTGPDQWGSTLPDGVTIPLSVLFMSLCVSLHSRAWPREAGIADVGPKVLVRYYYHSYGAKFLCWRLSFWGRWQRPYPLEGRGGEVC